MQIYIGGALKWTEIYQLPFKVAIDSRPRAFQFRVLHGSENRYRNFETNSEPMSQ